LPKENSQLNRTKRGREGRGGKSPYLSFRFRSEKGLEDRIQKIQKPERTEVRRIRSQRRPDSEGREELGDFGRSRRRVPKSA
jgi:hypothetical protein